MFATIRWKFENEGLGLTTYAACKISHLAVIVIVSSVNLTEFIRITKKFKVCLIFHYAAFFRMVFEFGGAAAGAMIGYG